MPIDKEKPQRKVHSYEEVYLTKKRKEEPSAYAQSLPMIQKLLQEREIAFTRVVEIQKSLDDNKSFHTEMELQIQELDITLKRTDADAKKLEVERVSLNTLLDEKKKHIEVLQEEKHSLELRLAKQESTLDDISRSSTVQFFVSILATILLGIGVNIITTNSTNWIGWLLVVTGIILSIIAFILSRKKQK